MNKGPAMREDKRTAYSTEQTTMKEGVSLRPSPRQYPDSPSRGQSCLVSVYPRSKVFIPKHLRGFGIGDVWVWGKFQEVSPSSRSEGHSCVLHSAAVRRTQRDSFESRRGSGFENRVLYNAVSVRNRRPCKTSTRVGGLIRSIPREQPLCEVEAAPRRHVTPP